MALIAIPFEDQPDQTRVVRSGDADGMRRNIERVLASFPADFLADAQLTGAAAGAVWECALTFTGDPISVTPLAPTASVLVRVVVAGDAPALESLLAVAELDLVAAGAMWIAKAVEAGAGGGAVWMAALLASTSPRPVPSGGGGGLPLLPLAVNSAGVDIFTDGSGVTLRTGSSANPPGAFNGGGIGNKALLGLLGFNMPIASLVSLDYTWTNQLGPGGPFYIPPTGGTVTTPYVNLVVDFGGGDLRICVVLDDSLAPAITGAIGSYLNAANVLTYSWNATQDVLIVNSPPNATPGGVVPNVSVGPTWPENSYSWAALIAANPAAQLVTAFPANPVFFPLGDGGMPVGATLPSILLVSGDSGNVVKSGKFVSSINVNGNPVPL